MWLCVIARKEEIKKYTCHGLVIITSNMNNKNIIAHRFDIPMIHHCCGLFFLYSILKIIYQISRKNPLNVSINTMM
jgi:hypothetical protein